MTTPSDAAIARAFYAISHEGGYYRTSILKRAKEIDDQAEPKKIHCPKCRGNYPVGRHCAGSPENPCPLKVKDD